jgi:hypothetical protein
MDMPDRLIASQAIQQWCYDDGDAKRVEAMSRKAAAEGQRGTMADKDKFVCRGDKPILDAQGEGRERERGLG